jgi:hypothetical protein
VPPFKTLYIDSSIFIAAGWPDISAQLRGVLSLSRILKVNVVMLQPVERELEAHWMRDCNKTMLKLQSISENANTLLGKVSQGTELRVPTREEIRAAYQKRVEEIISLGLERGEVEPRAMSEVFGMAIWHEKPFQDEGKGFQDAVICLGAIDHFAQSLQKHTTSGSGKGFEGIRRSPADESLAFVARDGDFEEETLIRFARAKGVNLILYRSLDDVDDILTGQLEDAVQRIWAEDRGVAADAVRREKDRLEAFINKNLEIPQQSAFLGEILRVNKVSLQEVLATHTPMPVTRAKPFNFSADIKVFVHAIVKQNAFPWPTPSPKLKVGEEPAAVVSPFFATRPLANMEPNDQVLERTVEIELRADDQGYTRIEPISVKLK